jgi:hypothetical protein
MNGAIYRRKSTKGVSAIAAAPWDWIDRDLSARYESTAFGFTTDD